MSTSKVQRTYGSRGRRNPEPSFAEPSSPPSALASSPPSTPNIARPSKRNISELLLEENIAPQLPPSKRQKLLPTASKAKAKSKTITKANSKSTPKAGTKTLTQLHFNIDQSIMRTCCLCNLSYTRGAPDDESLHRAHCTRARQGMEWGREEEKDKVRGAETVVVEVASGVKLKGNKKKGRIVSFPASIGGKIGSKLDTLLQTINLSLSAPELPESVLQCSKAYLFLLPHETQSHRERIVGCVIAQHISTAMAVVPPPSQLPLCDTASEAVLPVAVDADTNLFCSPTPLPTPMGVPRLFVPSSHRRLGIAHALLDAAAATFIYGCPLDPQRGQIAFSQPTGMGQAVMKGWGKGGVRVFEE
ncbi:hypothetical protein HYPSUDRAFT_36105 [Hypholoma sublateritium FD-334 SS-4]|uniref:N-acetyltransferase ECO1 n=1 Tax=Hypholoma sublateritium (strain FD-334 SS-4) TaxID=945553 RepID=A0A0D2Q5S9_HYPSF|nr:hypothetical protein HYPSUDRAFT_36105 [Hypholoma sublateritium FD-334 SS-4]